MSSKAISTNPKCAMCTRRAAVIKPRRYHPYIPIEQFVLCVTCFEHLRSPRHLQAYLTSADTNPLPRTPDSNQSNQANPLPTAFNPNAAPSPGRLATSPAMPIQPQPISTSSPFGHSPPASGHIPNGCRPSLAQLSSVQFRQFAPPPPQPPILPQITPPRRPQIVATAANTSPATSESPGEPVVVPSIYGDTSNLADYKREHILRLYVLTEQMVWAARKEPKFADFRKRLRRDYANGIYKAPTGAEIGVDRRVILAAGSVLADVGVKLDVENSRLVFPAKPICLPPREETRDTLEYAFSKDGLYLDVGAFWDRAFEAYPWDLVQSQHTIFECLFSLFGINVEPEKRASRRHGSAATLVLDRQSVANLLELASTYAPPTLKSLIVPLEGKSPNPLLTHAATMYRNRAQLPKPKTSGDDKVDLDLCAWCLNIFDKATYPFAKFTCTTCEMHLCSICADRVIGTMEMVSAIQKGAAYECLPCRTIKAAKSVDKESESLEKRRRARMKQRRKRHIEDTLKAVSGLNEAPRKKPRRKKSFLSIAPHLAHIIQHIPIEARKRDAAPKPQAEATREETGFAKAIEDLNIRYVKSFDKERGGDPNESGGTSNDQENGAGNIVKHDCTVCIKCFLPLGLNRNGLYCTSNRNESSCGRENGNSESVKLNFNSSVDTNRNGPYCSGNRNEGIGGSASGNSEELNFNWNVYTRGGGTEHVKRCSYKTCSVVLHVECLNSSGECGRHNCCVAGCTVDVRVKCRICIRSFCGEHLPLRNKIHIYNQKWIACDQCAPKLAEPRYPYAAQYHVEYKANLLTGLDADGAIRNLQEVIHRERVVTIDFINSIAKLHEKIDARDRNAVKEGVKKAEKLFRKRMDAHVRKGKNANGNGKTCNDNSPGRKNINMPNGYAMAAIRSPATPNANTPNGMSALNTPNMTPATATGAPLMGIDSLVLN